MVTVTAARHGWKLPALNHSSQAQGERKQVLLNPTEPPGIWAEPWICFHQSSHKLRPTALSTPEQHTNTASEGAEWSCIPSGLRWRWRSEGGVADKVELTDLSITINRFHTHTHIETKIITSDKVECMWSRVGKILRKSFQNVVNIIILYYLISNLRKKIVILKYKITVCMLF